jgi:cell division protein FtsB
MISYQEKNRWRRVVYSKTILVILLILLVWLGNSTYGIYTKQQKSQNNLARTQEELKDLEKRQQDLQAKIQRLNQATGVDEEIINKFRMVKEGEKMIVLVDTPEVDTSISTVTEKSWLDVVKSWFTD